MMNSYIATIKAGDIEADNDILHELEDVNNMQIFGQKYLHN